jgi:hypothetical protein
MNAFLSRVGRPRGLAHELFSAALLLLGAGVALAAPPPVSMPGAIKPGAYQPAKPPELRSLAPGLARPKVVSLAAPDLKPVWDEDARRESTLKGGKRIGLKRPLDGAITSAAGGKGAGDWQQLADGRWLWAVTVESQQALALRLHLEDLVQPAGAELTVYDTATATEAAGPYTAADVTAEYDLWTGAVHGSRVTLECVLPAGLPPVAAQFRVTELTHRYVPLGELAAAQFKAADTCNNDVTCFAAYLERSRAVGGLGSVNSSGELFCTGCLLNDANPAALSDYFLTANHCVENQTQASTTEFYWFYQTSACDGVPPDPAAVPRTRGGANYLAGADDRLGNDFALLQLRQATPNGVSHAGWTTEPVDLGAEIVGIHHPRGDFKRISFGNLVDADAEYWSIVWYDGVTEPGSSGSPIFNAAGQVIGQLLGGSSFCDNQDGDDQYGRFNRSFSVIQKWLQNQPTAVANDNFAAAAVLTGPVGNLAAVTAGASKQAGEPNHAGNTGGKSVWYRWVAPADSVMTFDTLGSRFDTVLAVYTGAALAGLTQVAANDDAGLLTSSVTFNAVAGTAYLVAVDGFGGGAGEIELTWRPGAAGGGEGAPNDNFASAITIEGPAGDVSARTDDATKEPGEPDHAGNLGGASVWYRWTAPASGPVIFDTQGSPFDTVLAVYTGAAVNALARVASNDDIDLDAEIFQSRVQFNAVAGRTYHLAVDGYNEPGGQPETGFVLLTWYPPRPATGAPPANDNFAAAAALAGPSGNRPGTNSRATVEASEPQHDGLTGGKSVWFTWVSPGAGLVAFDTEGSNFDTVLGVYTGGSLGTLVERGSNDDISSTARASRVVLLAAQGTTYRIALDGLQMPNGDVREGQYRLNWAYVAGTGLNDAFADAQPTGGASGRAYGDTRPATAQTGEPAHFVNNAAAKSLWYRWTAPDDGPVTFDTLGSTFDTVLAAYEGAALDALEQLDSGDDIVTGIEVQSRILFTAVRGQDYYVAVDGFRNGTTADSGSVVLNWDQPKLPTLTLGDVAFTGAQISVTVAGAPGTAVTLQHAAALAGPWTAAGTGAIGSGGTVTLSHTPAAGVPAGFYRALLPP